MSFLIAAPEALAAAADDVANIGSVLGTANAAAAAPTTEVLAAGADDVSAAVAELFSGHAQLYQTLAAQASSFHDEFVKLLSGNGTQYASAEFTNAEQTALNAINAPAESIFDRPLIGNGANGATPGANGQDGGILWETAATAPPGGSARTAGTVGPAASCSATAATVARVAPRPSAATGWRRDLLRQRRQWRWR